jgi:hypothetical protein
MQSVAVEQAEHRKLTIFVTVLVTIQVHDLEELVQQAATQSKIT